MTSQNETPLEMNRPVERARRLRRDMTDAERFVWRQFRHRRFAQFKFRRQVPLGHYIVDFMCFDRRLIIELDGGQHTLRREYDDRRTKWLEQRGYRVLRVWNDEVFDDWETVEQAIWNYLQADPSPPAPLPQGERGDRGAERSSSRDGQRPRSQLPAWQLALKHAVRDPRELCRMLELPAEFEEPAVRAAQLFPLFAPRSYIARIERGNPRDPLLRQILPLDAEFDSAEGFSNDPVGDLDAAIAPGLLHKYHGRVLMVTTGACAVHCRYCFRRHFPYQQSPPTLETWWASLRAIAADETIREVILSGGDPLTIVDPLLAELADRLAAIPHVGRLRIHTRLPIMIPERINDELLDWLRGTRLTPIVVIHANHPHELTGSAADAIERLVDAGIPVLNQSVLLRGVNDDLETLAALSERLVELRVMPYYLHQLDRVRGAAHFEVPVCRGQELAERLQARLPGYAVPRYVCEEAGASSKTLLVTDPVVTTLS
jgi:L-lysine 2,3-aminomutase